MPFPNYRNGQPQDPESLLLSIIPDNVKNIKNCCYCFDLKLGCKLIALLDGVTGLCEAFFSYKEIANPLYRSQSPRFSNMLGRDPFATLILGLVTCISAQILLAGVILQRKTCLLLWLYLISVITVAFMFYNISELCVLDVLSAVIQVYFILVVMAYYLQLRMIDSADNEFEVLFRASNLQLAL